MWRSGNLKNAVDEVVAWAANFQPSWFAMARSLKDEISRYVPQDAFLNNAPAQNLEEIRSTLRMAVQDGGKHSVFLRHLLLANERPSVSSSATTADQIIDRSQQTVILDGLDSSAETPQLHLNATGICSLAIRLSCIRDPLNCGLLRCRGVLNVKTNVDEILQCAFVFEVPEHLEYPRSLCELLTTLPTPSSNERLSLAKVLARSIMFVHNYDLVHKLVRPENILTFERGAYLPRAAFLIGFEAFRFAGGATNLRQKLEWQKDIYRHPSRQDSQPQLRYVVQHDIYSLGVCLLEIGLWTSFVVSEHSDGGMIYSPGPLLPIAHLIGMTDQTREGWQIKYMLVQLAIEKLPAVMGNICTSVVLTCLNIRQTTAQDSHLGVREEFESPDGILEGVRYSEKVLLELEKIVV